MNYLEAISYLTSKLKFGINPSLDRIEALCKQLGSPHLAYPVIQITGTNGKTSTTWLISSILQNHGLKVGAYTSPHLISYRERIQVEGQPISKKEMATLMTRHQPLIDKVEDGGERLTEFEVLTSLGYSYFEMKRVDCAVVEVGMGGRWDATSIVKPKVAVITNVDLEHTDRLGVTRREIAWEKAHVIKRSCSVVTGWLDEEIALIVGQRCREQESFWRMLGRDFFILDGETEEGKVQKFSVQSTFSQYENLSLPLLGGHQVKNAALAIETSELFLERSLNLSSLQKALKEVSCPGRLEVVQESPLTLLDGAHNPAGIKVLMETLEAKFKSKRIIIVLAVLGDKDIEGILKALTPLASSLIISENRSDRAAKAERVATLAAAQYPGVEIEVRPDLRGAFNLAVKKAGKEGVVCVAGSIYTVGEIKEFLEGKQPFLRKVE